MANYRLPLDLQGIEASNKVTQTRTLNMTSKMGDKFIIPADAPFFATGCEVYKVGTASPLVRGVDYELIFEFPDIFQITQQFVYGGIKFKDRSIAGQVRVVLQVLGGPFLQPVQNTLETVARNKMNINTGTWGELAGVPAGFPVLNHPMISDDFTGFSDINNTLLDGVALLLAGAGGGGGGDAAMTMIRNHMNNPTTAHTKAAVGLGNVPNFALATFAEADLGVNNKLVSPGIVRYMINKFGGLAAIQDLQTQLNTVKREVDLVQSDLQNNTVALNNLKREVTELNNAWVGVQQTFANVINTVTGLGNAVEGLRAEVEQFEIVINEALITVSEMRQTVESLKLVVNQHGIDITNLDNGLKALTERLDDNEEDLTAALASVKLLLDTQVYPGKRYIPAGSFHFRIKKGESRTITLVGPGGAGGILIPTDQIGNTDITGTRGGDTYLLLNTDLTNGLQNTGEVVLSAESGGTGQSTLQSDSGIEFFGKGGVGGTTTFTGFSTIITNANGASGVDGNSGPATSHPGAVGQTIDNKRFADGGASIARAGAGGAGALIKAKLTNTYDFDLEFTVVVGEPARNPRGNSFTPGGRGLAIIDLV